MPALSLTENRTLGKWFYAGAVTAGVTSDPLIIDLPDPRPVSVSVFPGASASARIEVSLSSLADVQNSVANWIPWGVGDVTANTADVLVGPVTAVRCVSTGGSTTWEVCA